MESKSKKHFKKMYVPWFPLEDTDSDFIGYIHQGLHHVIGEDVEFPDSGWSYMQEEPVSPFEDEERSDPSIHFKILDEFYSNNDLDASRINVLVHNGIVNLSGFVSSEHEKKKAEEAARSILHVWNVENEIQIEDESRPAYSFH